MKTTRQLRFAAKQMIVFDGDSLSSRRMAPNLDTWPFLQLMNWDVTWGRVLGQLLFCWRPELALRFRDAAIGGSTCRDMLARMDRTVLPHKPAWVIATVGGNDARIGIPINEFRNTLATYARRLRETSGGTLVFLGGLRPMPACSTERLAQQRVRLKYQTALRQLARTQPNVAYLDVGTGMARKAEVLYVQHPLHTVYSDGGHYNVLGATLIAGEILAGFGVVNV